LGNCAFAGIFVAVGDFERRQLRDAQPLNQQGITPAHILGNKMTTQSFRGASAIGRFGRPGCDNPKISSWLSSQR